MVMTHARKNPAPSETWGPNLHAWLETYWRAHGTNANAWADMHPGVNGALLSRWKSGAEPSIPAMLRIADALDVSLVDVLMAAGVLESDEGRTAVLAPPTLDIALRTDDSVPKYQRDAMSQMLSAFRKVEAERSGRVTGRTRKRAH